MLELIYRFLIEKGNKIVHKILFVESGTWGGGSFESLYHHLCIINKQHFQPVVVYLSENRFIEPVKDLSIPVYIIRDWVYSKQVPRIIRGLLGRLDMMVDKWFPSYYQNFHNLIHFPLINQLRNIIVNEEIDIIHLNDQTNRDLFGLLAAEKTGIYCISHLRSMRSGYFDHNRALYANQIVHQYIANSEATKEHWQDHGISPMKTAVVYNAIPSLEVKPLDIRQHWKIDNSIRYIIGCVGNLNSGKGHDFLLSAFAEFINQGDGDILLFMVGDGPLKNKLIHQSQHLNIMNRIVFTGYDPRAHAIIADLDLLILPSKSETFGRVLLEAMQVGTPVIATNTGGIPEIIKHEINGLLVNYGDNEKLISEITKGLFDHQLRKKMIKNGYITIQTKFRLSRYASAIEEIYNSVLYNTITPTNNIP